jgi:Tfp pilus assembly protein PilO
MNRFQINPENKNRYIYITFSILLVVGAGIMAYDFYTSDYSAGVENKTLDSETFKIVEDFKSKGVNFTNTENLFEKFFDSLESLKKDIPLFKENLRQNPFEI